MPIFDIFRGRTPEQRAREESKKEISLADKNRASAEKVVAALSCALPETLNFTDEETRKKLYEAYSWLVAKMKNAPTVLRMDVSKLDARLIDISDISMGAMKNRDLETVKKGVKFLKNGIQEYREDLIREEDIARQDEILAERVERLDLSVLVLKLSLQIFDANLQAQRKLRALEKNRPLFTKKFQETEEYIDANPLVYEAYENLLPDEIPTPAISAMMQKMDEVRRLNKQIKEDEAELTLRQTLCSSYQSQMVTLENQLSQSKKRLTQKEMDALKAALEKSAREIVQIVDDIKTLDDIDMGQLIAWEEVMKSAGLNSIFGSRLKQWKQIVRENDLIQQNEAEAERLRNEKLQTQETGRQLYTN